MRRAAADRIFAPYNAHSTELSLVFFTLIAQAVCGAIVYLFISGMLQSFEIQLSERWALDAIATYQGSEYRRSDDADRMAIDTGILFRDEDTDEFTGELRLRFENQDLRAMLGGYYSTKEVSEVFGSVGFDVTGIINGLDPMILAFLFPGQAPPFPPGTFILDSEFTDDAKIENSAVFAEVDYRFADRWSVRLAARLDNQNEDLEQAQQTSLPFIAPPGEDTEDTDFTEFLPFAALTYHINDASTLSLFFKESYRSGGVEIDLENARTNTFDPEFTQTYELAYRNVMDRIVLTANAFYTKYKDQQITSNPSGIPGLEITANAGESTKYGLEAAFDWQVTESLSWYASASILETEFDDFDENPTIPGDFNGNEFPYAPSFSASTGVTLTLGERWRFNVNASYQEETWVDAANSIENSDYFLVNANVTYDMKSWYAGFSISNLTDDEYITRNNAPPFAIQVGDPLLWQLKAGVRL